jgi:hypothetical protein
MKRGKERQVPGRKCEIEDCGMDAYLDDGGDVGNGLAGACGRTDTDVSGTSEGIGLSKQDGYHLVLDCTNPTPVSLCFSAHSVFIAPATSHAPAGSFSTRSGIARDVGRARTREELVDPELGEALLHVALQAAAVQRALVEEQEARFFKRMMATSQRGAAPGKLPVPKIDPGMTERYRKALGELAEWVQKENRAKKKGQILNLDDVIGAQHSRMDVDEDDKEGDVDMKADSEDDDDDEDDSSEDDDDDDEDSSEDDDEEEEEEEAEEEEASDDDKDGSVAASSDDEDEDEKSDEDDDSSSEDEDEDKASSSSNEEDDAMVE